MRLAFVGKGGVGKSAIAGTFIRLLARRGEPVLAIDSDPMPGLAFSLGLDVNDAPIPDDAIVDKEEGEEGPRFRLRPGLDAATAVELYAVRGPDGVRFLQFGKLRDSQGPFMRSTFVFRQIVRELPEGRWSVVGDLPGGTRQAFTGWSDFADIALVVVEPTAKSMLSGRRLARLVNVEAGPSTVYAVVNKAREPGDAELVSRRTGLEVVASVPWDEAFADAERRSKAPIDEAPDSAAVGAVELLVDRICRDHLLEGSTG